jgi:hypothetical protein
VAFYSMGERAGAPTLRHECTDVRDGGPGVRCIQGSWRGANRGSDTSTRRVARWDRGGDRGRRQGHASHPLAPTTYNSDPQRSGPRATLPQRAQVSVGTGASPQRARAREEAGQRDFDHNFLGNFGLSKEKIE